MGKQLGDGVHAGRLTATGRSRPSADVDAYIAAAPPKARPILRKIRRLVRRAAPGAEETISYRIPAFRYHGMLLYFAAFKSHIGLFPPIKGDQRLDKALAPYKGPKGNLRFPLDQRIPYGLIERIVRVRVKLNRAKATSRAKHRPS